MSDLLTSTRLPGLHALRDIAQALSAARDLDSTLDLIVRKTSEIMQVDSCSIYLLDASGETLRLRATTGLSSRALGRSTLVVGEGMTGTAVRLNRPVFAKRAQEHPDFKWVNEADEALYQSLCAIPLLIEDRRIGALNVQTRNPHEFIEEEIIMLSLIGDLAAGALSKARLYDDQRRKLEDLGALARASEAVTGPQYLDEILDVVVDMAARTMNAAVCSIFLLDESGTVLTLRSAKRQRSRYQHRPPLKLGEGIIGEVARSNRPAKIRDVRNFPGYLGTELARAEGLVSLLCVPLSVRDHVIGVMNCYTAEEHEFTPEQQTWFSTLANQTALAIENARLVTNAAIVREMHHRIKNNLQTIVMLMQLQLADAANLDAAEVLRDNMHRVNSIATVHEALSEQGFRLVDITDVLQRIAVTTRETLTNPRQRLTIRIDGDSILLPSRQATSLILAVNELMQNAVEHAFVDRDSGVIQISLGRSTEEIVILVRDNGRGFPETYRPGLGLEIVETIIREDLHGRLKLNRLPVGSEVSLRMPRTAFDDSN